MFFRWLACVFFYALQLLIRLSPSIMKQDLMQHMVLSHLEVGVLISTFYWGYACMQIPAGCCLDRFGVRRTVLTALTFCLMGSFIFLMAWHPALSGMGRLLSGMGSAFGFLSMFKISTLYASPQRLNLWLGGGLIVGLSLGSFTFSHGLMNIYHLWGWQWVWYSILLLGGILWFYAFSCLPKLQGKETKFSLQAVKSIFIPQTWIFGLYGFCMHTGMTAFADSAGIMFLHKIAAIPLTEASQCGAWIYVGIGIGALITPLLVRENFLASLMVLRLVSLVKFGILFSFIFMTSYMATGWKIWMLLLGLCIGGQFLFFTMSYRYHSPEVSATVSSILNAFCMCSGFILHPVMGGILDFFSSSTQGYRWMVLPIMVCPLVAYVLTYRIHQPKEG